MKTKSASSKLSKEITVCLILKVILLTMLWLVCYSHPFTQQVSMQKVAQMFHSTI